MEFQILALAIFAAVFVLATLRKVHTGVLMFAVAAGVGIFLASMPLAEVIAGFPLDLLILLVGVTYFFAIAQANGTIDRIIDLAVARVGNNAFLLPLLFFGLTAGIAAMGSPLAGLVMTPIGMPIARKHRIDQMLMGLAIGCGLSAGGFAPTSLFGIVTTSTATSAGVDLSPMLLFGIALGANLLLLIAAYVMFGGRRLIRERFSTADFEREFAEERAAHRTGSLRGDSGSIPVNVSGSAADGVRVLAETAAPASPRTMQFVHVATVVCMIGLIASVVGLAIAGRDPDIGVLCFVFASALMLIDPRAGRAAISKIDWSTVLLVGGIITFVGVLQHLGSVDLLGDAASHFGSPIVSAFLICVIGGLVSAFASTTGMLAAMVPLAIPLVASGGVEGWAVIAALGVCSSIVDVSPFSTVGATIIATADESERQRITALLTRWGLSMVIIGPLVLVGLLVIPASF